MQRSLADRLRSLTDRLGRRMSAPTLKIGVSARILHPQPGSKGLQSKTLQYLEQTAAHWLMSRNVLVLMVPTVDTGGLLHRSEVRLADYARHLDGLMLQGGADVCPLTYGEEPLAREWVGDRLRDEYEIELLHSFIEAGKPVLGICRGAQLINVAYGGTLYQDIVRQVPQAKRHVTDDYEKHRHELRFEPDGWLARLYQGTERALVTSIHHQSVKTLGQHLSVEAWSASDQVIEAIRGTGKGFVLGVQWHPEFHVPGDTGLLDSAPLLDEFLRAAERAA
ncbi:MAG: type 1 glutamine amidotransferase [Betaproteobacteria bacterium]|nr:type 1 glutamine amidotransferase [Betaproteobacteria bacterium]MDH5219900.1 type 1 glutamine amidotransferase [Betaproteobacteria bacterium]MDH5349600.1 type 1 glutamine amidotransferase [Betaproteobacteria bacterium]